MAEAPQAPDIIARVAGPGLLPLNNRARAESPQHSVLPTPVHAGSARASFNRAIQDRSDLLLPCLNSGRHTYQQLPQAIRLFLPRPPYPAYPIHPCQRLCPVALAFFAASRLRERPIAQQKMGIHQPPLTTKRPTRPTTGPPLRHQRHPPLTSGASHLPVLPRHPALAFEALAK
jgi:hypothetical protein